MDAFDLMCLAPLLIRKSTQAALMNQRKPLHALIMTRFRQIWNPGCYSSLTIKAHLPNWQYISVGDETTVRNAALRKTDLVCFVTAHLSHTLYYAMVGKSQDRSAQIGYISRTNVNMALCELWGLTHKEK